MRSYTCVLVAVLAAAATAVPAGLRNQECATTCNKNNKFFYEIGRQYVYEYEAETQTVSSKDSLNDAFITVSAKAAIQPVSPCEYLLSLSDVTLHGSDKSEVFAREVTKRSLRFSFENGKINNICGSEKEQTWVLNFKKGVLSSFQNSMDNLQENEVLTETDVSGTCETSYSYSQEDSEGLIITKTKKLNECTHKAKIHQTLSTFGYAADSFIQNLPLLQSNQRCTQHISDEIIKEVTCSETHVFSPFNAQDIKTLAKNSLKLLEVKPSSSQYLESFRTRQELLFDPPNEVETGNSLEKVETILSKIQILSEKGIKKEVPALFSELVSSLREIKSHQILSLYERSGERLRTFIKDALTLSGTPEAIRAFVDLIIKGEVPETDMNIWFTSLAFMKNPSLEFLSALQPLLEEINDNEALLGVSSLINTFCNKNTECENKGTIQRLLRRIEAKIGNGCRATSEEEKTDILFALKAIGNAGRFINAESALKRCYLEDNSMEVKIAAIDSWRRVPCSHDRSHFLSLYSDQYQDNEIRIASYLALMHCPTQDLIQTLKDRLTSEGVNQVESFVWSHLTNLQESADPDKQWVRHLIGEEFLKNKFSNSALKLSRNFESSFLLKEQKVAGTVESNVIFAGNSFLPRSSMLNMTINLFGESINLFEIGGRLEGFEAYIEKFFGPNGYYPEETIATIVKNLRKEKEQEETILSNYLTKQNNDPHGSYYLKVLGNELFYRHFDGIENAVPEISVSDIFEAIIKVATDGSVDYTKSFNIVNSEFIFPTITGFPIVMKLNGTATLGLQIDGEFNFEDFTSFDVQGKLRPSAAVTFDGAMVVDATVTKSGFEMVSTMNSATGIEGKIKIKGGKLVDIVINAPEEKVEVFEFSSKVIRIEKDFIPEEDELEVYDQDCSNYFGIETCSRKFSSPSSKNLVAYTSKLSLEKTDTYTSYIFHLSNSPEKTTIIFDMPNGKVFRKWELSLTKGNNQFGLNFHTPYGGASSEFTWNENQILIEAETKSELEYLLHEAKFRIERSSEAGQRNFETEVYLRQSQSNDYIFKLEGGLSYDVQNIEADAEIVISGLPSSVKFKLERKDEENSVFLSLKSMPVNLSLKGNLNVSPSKGSTKLEGSYQFSNNEPQSLTTEAEYEIKQEDNNNILTASLKADELELETNMEVAVSETGYDTKVDGHYGNNDFKVDSKYDLIWNEDLKNLKLRNDIYIPILNIPKFIIEEEVLLSREELLLHSKLEQSKFRREAKVHWQYDDSLTVISNTISKGSFDERVEFTLKKNAPLSYNIKVLKSLKNRDEIKIEIVTNTNIEKENVDSSIVASYRSNTFDSGDLTQSINLEFDSKLQANPENLKSETTITTDGKVRFLNIYGKRPPSPTTSNLFDNRSTTSLSLESNFLETPFNFNAKIENSEDENKFSITSNMKETKFEGTGRLTSNLLEGKLQYKDHEIKMSAKLSDNGFDLEAELSPEEKFSLFVNYGFQTEMFLETSLETPFTGWEKQDARFSLSLQDTIVGQVSATWQNTHHLGMTLEIDRDFKDAKKEISGNFRLSSTISGYERMELSLRHMNFKTTVKTKIEGKFNSHVLKGSLEAFPVKDGYEAEMKLLSPFFEYLELSFDYQKTNQDLSIGLDLTSGSEKSRILLKGNMIDFMNMSGSFISTGSLPFLPDMTATAVLQSGSKNMNIEVKGKLNGQKLLFLANHEWFISGNEKHANLVLKLVTSSSKVFSGSLSAQMNNQNEFKVDLGVSSSFIPGENIKGHIDGNFSSLKSAMFIGYISGQNLNGRVSLKHLIDNGKMETELNTELNSHRASLMIEGDVNLENMEGSLNSEIQSTLPALDGFKLNFVHHAKEGIRETTAIFSKNEKSVKIYHSYSFTSFLNWSNLLRINDKYTIKNVMSSSGNTIEHETILAWLDKEIVFNYLSNTNDGIHVISSLETPWMSKVKLTLYHEKKNLKNDSRIELEYGNGKTMLIESQYKFLKNSKEVSLNISNDDWSLAPIKIEVNQLREGSNVHNFDLKLQLSQYALLTLHSSGDLDNYDSSFNAKINSNNKPYEFISKYSFAQKEHKVYIELDCTVKCFLDLKFTGDCNEGEMTSTLALPKLFKEPMYTKLTFDFKSPKMKFNIENTHDGKVCKVDALINPTSFIMNFYGPNKEGKLHLNFVNEDNNLSGVLDFKSPCSYIEDTHINAKLNLQEVSTMDMELKYGDRRIKFNGEVADGFKFDAKTSFTGWETLKAELQYTLGSVSAMFAKNNDVYKLNATGNFNFSRGDADLTILLPYEGYENNFISTTYSLSGDRVNIDLNSKFGLETLKFNLETKALPNSNKQMKISIESPFKLLRNAFIEATVENNTVKFAGELHDYRVTATMKSQFNSATDGNMIFSMTSNIPNWTTYSVEANIQLSRSPFTCSLKVRHEEQLRVYTVSFGLTPNNFDLKIMTPIPYIENISAFGKYKLIDNKLETSVTLSKNEDTFSLSGYLDVKKLVPEINLTMKTPLTGLETINLIIKANTDNQRSINFLFELGDQIYKLNLNSNLNPKQGKASIEIDLPISGFRLISYQLSYDFLNENKHFIFIMSPERIEDKVQIEGKFVSNEFYISLQSPIKEYKTVVINGQYHQVGNDITVSGKVVKNEEFYRFEGTVVKTSDGYKLETSLPVSQFNSVIVKTELSDKKLIIQIETDGQINEISMNYDIIPGSSAFLNIKTPFESLSYLAVGCGHVLGVESASANFYAQKNNDRVEMSGEYKLSPYDFNIKMDLEAFNDVKYSIHTFYDFVSLKKEAGFIFENGDNIHKYVVEALYKGVTHGYVRLVTNCEGHEVNGFEYKFNTLTLSNTEVYMTLIYNSKETRIGLINKFGRNEMKMKIMTPFENYDEFGIETKLDLSNKEGKFSLLMGAYKLCLKSLMRPDNFYICLETPFETVKVFRISLRYEWNSNSKNFQTGVTYNDIVYEFYSKFEVFPRNPKLNLKIETPHDFIKLFNLDATINLDSSVELVSSEVTYNERKYLFSAGYEYENLKIAFNINAITPFEGWYNARMFGKFNFQGDTKTLQFTFEKENFKKSIFLSGKILNDEIDFDVQVPFESIGNFKTRGSLNRSKRSVEFMMMNDMHSGGIIASFNSLKIKAKTPFKDAKDVNFEITKNNKGTWTVNYQRDSKKVFFNFSVEPKKKGFSISIESEIPGWEFMAITGRLDPEEVVAYIEGQMTTGMVHISGNGMFGDKTGSLTITATSPFNNYKEVITTIEYNSRRNIFTFDSHSTSSEYKIILEIKKGLFVNVFVPNEEQNTKITGKLTIFKGTLAGSSRFPPLRTFSINYSVALGPKITSNMALERNGLKVFELEFERDGKANTAHLMIHGRRGENHSMLHFHRERFEKLEAVFSRNGKEFKVDLNGSDTLPQKGTIDFTIVNSFRFVPRTVTGKLDVDRTTSPRKIDLEVHWHTGKVYFAHLTYNADISNPTQGDFILRIVTPERSMAAWKDISGKWSFNNGELDAEINAGPRNYKAHGKLSQQETDLVIESNTLPENYFVQWKIKRGRSTKDYFINVGREGRYVMFKLKGTFDTIFNADVEGSLRISRFMAEDFNYTAKWTRGDDGLSGGGTFNFGQYTGTHTLTQFKRDPNERAAKFHWESSSNVPNFSNIVLHGEYNLARRYVDIKLTYDTDEVFIKGSLDNFTLVKSENTLEFHLPKIGDGQITLSHDFTDPLHRSITAIGKMGSREVSYVIDWTRNEDLTVLDLTGNIDSAIFGTASIKGNFDVRNIDDAKGSLEYKRNNDKFVSIQWHRKKTSSHVEDELTLSSHFPAVPNAKIYFSADWSKDFTVDSGIEWRDQAIESHLKITPKKTTAYLNTPFEHFGNINLDVDYDLKKAKSKSVHLVYTRGDKVVEINFDLKLSGKKNGEFHFKLTSPLEALRTLTFDATWKKGNFHANYKRNDIEVEFEGKAEVKTDKSSFDLKFTMPDGRPIEAAFSYDVESFVKGKESSPKDILHVKLDTSEYSTEFTVKGYRTSENVYLEIDGESSLDVLNTFHLKLDSELNLDNREGEFEIKVNEDFHFHVRNTFEKRPKGFYARSQFHSSLTDLPGLTIGFGKDGDSFLFTTGYGDEREIQFTFKGKDHFRKGFYGTIDMPRRGIYDLEYSVNYNFKSDDKLNIDAKIMLGEGRAIEANIVYNSDGVKARMSSPWTGLHSVRAKRSISEDYFMADIGVDNYGFTFESDNNKAFKKGLKIEGEIFGEKALFYGFLNLDSISNSQGNLIIETPFDNFRKMGGSFSSQLTKDGYHGEINMNVFIPILGQLDFDTNEKIKGNAFIQFGKLIYELTCDFRANDSGNMKGNLIIKTPHTMLDVISIDGSIDSLSLKDFRGNFQVTYPGGEKKVGIHLKVNDPLYSLDLKVKSNKNVDCRWTSNYSLIKSPLTFKGESFFYLNNEMLFNSISELSFKSVDDIKFAYSGKYMKGYLEGSVGLEVNNDQWTGNVIGSLMDKKLKININAPKHLEELTVTANYQGKETHNVTFKLTKALLNRHIKLELNSTILTSGNFEIIWNENSLISAQVNFGMSDKKVLYILFENAIQHTLQIKLNTIIPFFSNKFLNVDAEVRPTNGDLLVKFNDGKTANIIKSHYEQIGTMFKIHTNLKVPFITKEERNIVYEGDFNQNVKFLLESDLLGDVNSLQVEISKEYGLMVTCISPLLPTGMCKLELNLVFSPKDLDFRFSFANAEKSLTSEGKLKWNVDNETEVFVGVRTPFQGYENIKFGVRYIMKDMTEVALFAEPFNLEAQAYYGTMDSTLKAGFKFRTGEDADNLTTAKAVIPLDGFGPEFSALISGMEYNISAKVENTNDGKSLKLKIKNMPLDIPEYLEMSYRAKVPYEFDVAFTQFGSQIPDSRLPSIYYMKKFGIVFDSSFLHLAKLFPTLKFYIGL